MVELLSQWKESDVASWLRSQNAREADIAVFVDQEIDGEAILELEKGDIQELFHTFGARKRVWKKIKQLRKEFAV